MHRIPVKTTYKVQEPYPEQLTLTQLLDISEPPKEFKLTEVCWWTGAIGIVPQQWSAELLDWFLPKLEYVCVRRLDRGKQVAAGLFKYCRSSEWFVTLADADNKEISHPKYLKKESETECTYSSTAIWIWSPHCLCKSAAEERRDLGVHCICQVVFDRYSCNCQQLHQAEAVKAEILDGSIEPDKVDGSIEAADEKDETKKQAEEKELDEVLSQNFCSIETFLAMAANATAGSSRQPRLKQQARRKVTVIKDTIVKDASAARAVKIPKPAAPKRKTEPKEFNISLTLGIAGIDVPDEIFDKLQTYLEEKATMAIMAFERGDAHLLLHIQSMFTIRTTSTRKLKEDIRAAVGWKDTAPLGNSLCLRVERIWQGCVAPETITITDVDYILLGSSHNDRYFSSSHRMELLIAEARKHKEEEDHKPNDPVQVMDGKNDREDRPEETDDEKVGREAEEDGDPFEVPAGNETVLEEIQNGNANLQQPRAVGSPEEDFDADELPNVVDLDDIIEPGMDAEVLMFDLLAAGYGVRRRPPPRPEERQQEQQQEQQQAQNVIPRNNEAMPEYIPLVRPPT
ncbi:hypothetical protein R1sor_017160 [Riccia sorocarpa]|uniref:Uncharacterized protein n=1 Tax=Riccia sorocarpa TaxID=122646 RepID=A0ABD3I601_9MARC